MQYREIIVTVKVPAETPVRIKDKEKLLQAFSNLPADDQARMSAIMQNKKALAAIKDNWALLEQQFK